MAEMGHKPAYLSSPGRRDVRNVLVGFCCAAAKEVQCQEPTSLARFLSLERCDQNRGSVKLSATRMRGRPAPVPSSP
jgi:hypothetical protein